jgi:hypothetical protein
MDYNLINLKPNNQDNKDNQLNPKFDINKLNIPNNFILIEKNLFNCIICFEIKENLLETECCGIFICNDCNNILNSNKCPICKKVTIISISKLAKRIFNNSITKCKICDFSDNQENLKKHYLIEHLKKNSDIVLIFGNQNLLDIFKEIFSLKNKKKFPLHSHELNLCYENLEECKGNSFFQNPDFKFKYIDNVFYLDIEDISLRFLSRFYYKCNECEFSICYWCKDLNEISFMCFLHDHPLELNLEENLWICDMHKNKKDYCIMGINTKEKSKGITRYSCLNCKFDLCDYCIKENLME